MITDLGNRRVMFQDEPVSAKRKSKWSRIIPLILGFLIVAPVSPAIIVAWVFVWAWFA